MSGENIKLWKGMPEFKQVKKEPFKKCSIFIGEDSSVLFIRFESELDFINRNPLADYYDGNNFYVASRALLSELLNQKITPKTKSLWHPFKSHWGGIKHKYVSDSEVQNRYPVYIVSKGRAKNGLTTKALDKMGVPHYIVVELHEACEYIENTNGNILVLPSKYLNNYDTCDDLGVSKSKGPGAARNFCIDHSKENGFKRHWVMDDNLDAFHYLNKNEKYEVECASTLAACEDFTERFSNVPLSGMNYYSFCKKTDKVPPFITNTRIYSCLLVDNESGYRWRGRYNEDTDLSLRILKDGLCTIQFNAFLCGKVTTQRMRGGNSKEFYDGEGTLPKSKMIEDLHPDAAKVVWKFNRWHHLVNYKQFKNKLIKSGSPHDEEINNYGLTMISK
ncbi:hypothetical protein NVP1076O_12 [Vibrio phage 1.076.O._10N.286.51.B7]|nr:hypothetical protein NVP1076O_12 [Vibrio phage 1.076.O._10N.286.51.B7]